MKVFTRLGKDKEGRETMLARPSQFRPEATNAEEVISAIMWIISRISATMPAQFDNFNVIADMTDLGWANFDRNYMHLRLQMGQTTPENFHKMYVINYGTIFNAIATLMWPFVPTRVQQKVKMIPIEALLEDFHLDQLPSDCGGTMDFTILETLQWGPNIP